MVQVTDAVAGAIERVAHERLPCNEEPVFELAQKRFRKSAALSETGEVSL
jgi:hypothetical protein